MDIIVLNLFYLYSEQAINVMGNIPTSIYCRVHFLLGPTSES